jgi:hypothetical protein
MNNVASAMLLGGLGLIVGMTLMYIWMRYGNPDER